MADLDDVKEGKDFGLGRPVDTRGFFLKGCANYDWGMKNRMSRIFNPAIVKSRCAGHIILLSQFPRTTWKGRCNPCSNVRM